MRARNAAGSEMTWRSQWARDSSICASSSSTVFQRLSRRSKRSSTSAAISGSCSPSTNVARAARVYSSCGRSSTLNVPPALAVTGSWLASQKLKESMV